MFSRLLFLAALTFVLAACGKSAIKLEGFDKAAWQSDTYGCKGERLNQLDLLKSYEEKLLQRSQNEIKMALGTPDEHELYERTRKFFYYYLEPSDKCGDSTKAYPRILQIRFNALDISNEIFVKNE